MTVGLLVRAESDPNKIIAQESTIVFNPNTNILSYKVAEAQKNTDPSPAISFNPDTDSIQSQLPQIPQFPNTLMRFPPAALFAGDRVSVEALHATGKLVEETNYAAVGGGMGTFVGVDTVRTCGVKGQKVIGNM